MHITCTPGQLLATVIEHGKGLKTLRIVSTSCSHKAFQFFRQYCPWITDLSVLFFWYQQLGPKEAKLTIDTATPNEDIMDAVNACPAVTKLVIINRFKQSKDRAFLLKQLGDACATLAITSLTIEFQFEDHRVPFDAFTAEDVFYVPARCPLLKEFVLFLDEDEFCSTEGIKGLAKTCKHLQKIRLLKRSGYKVTDDSLLAIWKGCPELTHLNIERGGAWPCPQWKRSLRATCAWRSSPLERATLMRRMR